MTLQPRTEHHYYLIQAPRYHDLRTRLTNIAYSKIGPQCVLGVLCLNLFLSVEMLFSNISVLELNCYK